jgi:hypothetical protein
MQFPSKIGRIALAIFVTVAVALPARAVEPDKYVPSDSEALVVVNVHQILNSELVKKYGLEQLKTLLKSNDEANKFLKATGLDPLKDIHSVIVGASLGGAKPKFQIVVHGKFDVDKIDAAIADEAKSKPDELKIEKKGDLKLYVITPKGTKDEPLFAAFANKDTLIVTQSADATAAGVQGKGGKVNATLLRALEKFSGKESIYAAAVIPDEMKKGMAANPQLKDLAPKLQYVTGAFDLTNDFKLNLAVQTSDAKAADKVKGLISQFMPLVGLMAAGQQENLGPVINDLVKKIEVKKDDKNAVSISLTLTEAMMKQMQENANGSAEKGKQ